MTEVTDNVCPFATDAVSDVAHGDVQNHHYDSEINLNFGDLLVVKTNGIEEWGENRHGEQASRNGGFRHDEAEISASRLDGFAAQLFFHSF